MNQFGTSKRTPQTSVLGTILGFMVLLFIGSFLQTFPLYAAIFSLFSPVFQRVAEDMLNGTITTDEATLIFEELTEKASNHPLCIVASLVGTMALVGVFIFWCCCVQKRPLSFLGIRKKKALPQYLLGVLVGFLMFAAAIGISVLSGAASVSMSQSINWAYIGLFFFGFLIQGFEEELLLRGYLMNTLCTGTSRFQAVFLSSLLFGLLHIGNQGISYLALLNLTLFGIFTGIYFIRTNSIWGVAAIHTVWNFVQGNFWGCSVSGMPLYDSILVTTMTPNRDMTHGGAFGPEGGIAVTIVLVTGIFLLLWTALPSAKKAKKM